MRISDWSSDVCSSDLGGGPGRKPLRQVDPDARLAHQGRPREGGDPHKESARLAHQGRPRAAKPPDCTRYSHLDGVSFTTRAADLPCGPPHSYRRVPLSATHPLPSPLSFPPTTSLPATRRRVTPN